MAKSHFDRRVDIPKMLMLLGIKSRGRKADLWARCPHPDHSEKSASWHIDDAGSHYCFGCKWYGGPLELVLQRIGLSSYAAAHGWVEEKGLYHDGLVPLSVELEIIKPDVRNAMQMPTDARILPLAEWVTTARRYADQRGITAGQVKRWGLGYATGGYYANRILLPTRSRLGDLINITGRAWSKTKKPKYKNAKELHGWDPGAIFGEQYWPENATRCTLILCEGELNALACERRGIPYIGALGGSQLEKEQVMKLGQFGRIVLAMDIDKAGSDIAKALQATLSRWRQCDIVRFPDRRDPNDLEIEDPKLLDCLLKEVA